MTARTLADWLTWQETINLKEIDLGLERVAAVAERLAISPPPGKVFTVAGTNGKGSTATTLAELLAAAGYRVGLYTSPHLVRYNERVRVNGVEASDADLVDAFERIEAVRGDSPLTFFEYGTLAGFLVFTAGDCDAWVLEIGLGGRLDAVNIIDPDVALITTVALDHEAWLGDTVEKIAFEKAGIMRGGVPAFYGDEPVPESLAAHAASIGAELGILNHEYGLEYGEESWSWRGRSLQLEDLPYGSYREQQARNQGLALAGLEAIAPEVLDDPERVRSTLAEVSLPGRFQRYSDQHDWVFDVSHNPQAVHAFAARLAALPPMPTVVIVGLLADKQLRAYIEELRAHATGWVVTATQGARGDAGDGLAAELRSATGQSVEQHADMADAVTAARAMLPGGGRILVCGSFTVVGPALQQLGLY